LIFNFIITNFDCQDGSQGGGISEAFALARSGVAPPLIIRDSASAQLMQCNDIYSCIQAVSYFRR